MRGKGLAAGLLAVVAVLAWSGASRGGDTIRLNGVNNAPTKNLVDDGQGAETVRVWYRGGFGWGGLGGWGGYRGLGWGGWGYPGFGWGGYRGLGWGGLGWGGLGYGGLGWGGLGWGGLDRPFGFGFGYGLGYGGFYPGFGLGYGGFWPCAGVSGSVYTLNGRAAVPGAPQGGNLLPAPAPQPRPGNDGTFPYDGGPAKPVPDARDTPPASTTPRSVPMEGRSVSLPKAAPKWSYPAYGEIARRIAPASERTYLTRGEDKNRR